MWWEWVQGRMRVGAKGAGGCLDGGLVVGWVIGVMWVRGRGMGVSRCYSIDLLRDFGSFIEESFSAVIVMLNSAPNNCVKACAIEWILKRFSASTQSELYGSNQCCPSDGQRYRRHSV